MPDISLLLLFVLFLILWGEFVNGWTDAANSIATVVATRVLSPKHAILMATLLNILGTLSGTAVAMTIGKDIITSSSLSLLTLASAMIAIISWSTLAWKYGIPTSESHALVAGLAGSAFAVGGIDTLQSSGWTKIGIGLLFSTFLGFGLSYLLFRFLGKIFSRISIHSARRFFGKAQIFSAAFVAFGHGSNDGQKFIGAFSLALFLGGITPTFTVPYWVILLCATTMGIGTSIGGWRIIKTMGAKLARLEPQHGFCAETAAALAIETASRFGIPLSTTHTITTSIMGVGYAQGTRALRYDTAGKIALAWILTFPFCGLLAFSVTKLIVFVFQ